MFLRLVTIMCIAQCMNCKVLEFYSENDYVGFLPIKIGKYGSWIESPEGCFNFPSNYQKMLSSVRASDNCVILYDQRYCLGNSIKIDEDEPSIIQMQDKKTHDNFNNRALSYRLCDKDEGGAMVNVQLYNSPNYIDEAMEIPEVCKCITLPKEMANFQSIDNHHSCVELYTTEECMADEEGKNVSVKIFPGTSSVSSNLTSLDIYGKIQSFRPCAVPPDCFNIRAEIFHYAISDEEGFDVESATATMSMQARSRFYNNGTAKVTQEYSAKRSVKEVTEVEKITFSRTVKSWSTTSSLTFQKKSGFMGTGGSTTYSVEKANSETNESGEQDRNLHIHEETVEFEVSQKIEVPACTMYVVDSEIKVVENYPMSYRAYFTMKGEFDNRRMTAEEIKKDILEHMPAYTYNHTVDEYTVVAYASSVMKASFGVETSVDGFGSRIPYCYPN